MHTEAHLFSVPNDCLWYDKLWGPSQGVVTLFSVAMSFNIFYLTHPSYLQTSCNIFEWLPPPRAFSYHRLQIRCSVQEGVEKLLILVLRVVVDLEGKSFKMQMCCWDAILNVESQLH